MVEAFEAIWNTCGGGFNAFTELLLLGLLILLFVLNILKLRKTEKEGLWNDIVQWLFGSIGAVIAIFVCLWFSQYVFLEDHLILYKYLTLRIVGFAFGIVALTGGILFVDKFTRGDWMAAVEKAEYGPTIVISVIVLAISLILVYM